MKFQCLHVDWHIDMVLQNHRGKYFSEHDSLEAIDSLLALQLSLDSLDHLDFLLPGI